MEQILFKPKEQKELRWGVCCNLDCRHEDKYLVPRPKGKHLASESEGCCCKICKKETVLLGEKVEESEVYD